MGTSSGVFGAGKARAVGILQALVKSTLIQAAAGGGKTVDHSGSSADNDSEPASATEESLPGRDLETVLKDPRFARVGAGYLEDDRYIYLSRRDA